MFGLGRLGRGWPQATLPSRAKPVGFQGQRASCLFCLSSIQKVVDIIVSGVPLRRGSFVLHRACRDGGARVAATAGYQGKPPHQPRLPAGTVPSRPRPEHGLWLRRTNGAASCRPCRQQGIVPFLQEPCRDLAHRRPVRSYHCPAHPGHRPCALRLAGPRCQGGGQDEGAACRVCSVLAGCAPRSARRPPHTPDDGPLVAVSRHRRQSAGDPAEAGLGTDVVGAGSGQDHRVDRTGFDYAADHRLGPASKKKNDTTG